MKMFVFVLSIVCCYSCSKPNDAVADPLIFISDGKQINFPSYSISAKDYCNQKLYTINTGQVMISFIADAIISRGTYSAGLNYWGNYTENIQLIVDQLNGEKINGSFLGAKSHGLLR